MRQKRTRGRERRFQSLLHSASGEGISHLPPPAQSWCLIQTQAFQNLKRTEEAIPGTFLVNVISELTVTIKNRQHLWILLNASGIYILFPILTTICTGGCYTDIEIKL